jgi:hypothetical protein
MKKIFSILILVVAATFIVTAQQPSELWITGSAVPTGAAKLTARPNGKFFYSGALTAGEFKFTDTETVGASTRHIVPVAGQLVRADKIGWEVLQVSDEVSDGGGKDALIDNNRSNSNFWHSNYNTNPPCPHWAVVDMKNPVEIARLVTQRRAVELWDGQAPAGDTKTVEYYIGDEPDPESATWKKIAVAAFLELRSNHVDTTDVATPFSGRYLKVVATESNRSELISIVEVDVYTDPGVGAVPFPATTMFEISDDANAQGWEVLVGADYRVNVDFAAETVSKGTFTLYDNLTDLWITGTAVGGNTLKLTARPDGTFFYPGALLPGEFKLIDTETITANTHYIAPQVGLDILCDKTGWEVLQVSSYNIEDNKAALIDNNYTTSNFWESGMSGVPQWAIIDMKSPIEVSKLVTYRRSDWPDTEAIEYYISNDPNPDASTWTKIVEETDTWVNNVNTSNITTPVSGQYLKIVGTRSAPNRFNLISIVEVDVYAAPPSIFVFPEINAFELTGDAEAPSWTISAGDPMYKVNVNFSSETLTGGIFTPWSNLYIIGGATTAGWRIGDAIRLLPQANPNVWVFDGELRNRTENPEPTVFKFVDENISYDSPTINTLHPYNIGETIIGSTNFMLNGQDYKWTIDETQEGRYIITINLFLETITATFGDGTGLNPISPDDANDPVIQTLYYNLQGIRVQQPASDGIYIIQKIHKSNKTEVSKILYRR